MKENTEKPQVFDREFFVQQGKLGGEKTKELYGITHFQKLNKKSQKKKVDKSS